MSEPPEETEVWERHAAWWQREFTGGADVEYAEQILPLAAEHLAGADRVLDLGCGEGQIARLAVKGGASRVVGVDAAAAQIAEAVRRAGGVRYA
ncbi:MAG: methyltransferase domain-containing protein, partial [Acidimicrobiales bacterium]